MYEPFEINENGFGINSHVRYGKRIASNILQRKEEDAKKTLVFTSCSQGIIVAGANFPELLLPFSRCHGGAFGEHFLRLLPHEVTRFCRDKRTKQKKNDDVISLTSHKNHTPTKQSPILTLCNFIQSPHLCESISKLLRQVVDG